MALRRPSIGSLERELEALRTTIAETEAEQVRQGELAETAATESRAVSDDSVAFADATRRAREASDERTRLGYVLVRRNVELVELEQRLELARYESERDALESALARAHEASKKFAAEIGRANRASAGLLAARDEVDSAAARARELCPADVDFEPPGPDEPEWADVDRLIVTLQAGPRQPLATLAEARAEIHAQHAQTDANAVARAVKEALGFGAPPDHARIKMLPPELLPKALTLAERMRDEELDRRAKANAEAFSLATGGEQTKLIAESLNRQVERIRELVAEADKAEIAA